MVASQTKACSIKKKKNIYTYLNTYQARCGVCLRKQHDKPRERCSIKYVHNHVEQKVSDAETSGERDARVVYS